ncbi:DNA polymerase III PolC-type [Erysipelotrichaceae bacterium]|nr:DNA polymerase III PolC-type [Erysipelotrichaceae bacterium]
MSKENKMDILIQQLSLGEGNLYDFLHNAILTKVEVNRKTKTWVFHIKSPNFILPEDYVALRHAIVGHFPYDVKLMLSNSLETELTQQEVADYFKLFLHEDFADSDFLHHALEFTTLHFEQNKLSILCADGYHLLKYTEKKNQLEQEFLQIGLKLVISISIGEQVKEKFDIARDEKSKKDIATVNADITEVASKMPPKDAKPQKPTISRNASKTLTANFGAKMLEKIQFIKDIHNVGERVMIEGFIFDKEVRKTKTGKFIATLKVTDYTDSIYISKWLQSEDELDDIKKGMWLYILGKLEIDPYKKNERVVSLAKFQVFEKVVKRDHAEKKRIELHAHTKMSQLDGVVSAEALVNRAIQYEHEAIAITDHAVVHSFPNAYAASDKNKKTKVLFGCELNIVDYKETTIFYPEIGMLMQDKIDDCTYIVFDIETTGLSPNFNKMIEIAAVKVKNGMNMDIYETFINPHELVSSVITELTNIQQRDVDSAPDIRKVMLEFLAWCGPLEEVIFVAHNAHFDIRFLKAIYTRLFEEELRLNYLDSLTMARHLYPQIKRHGLKAMAKMFTVSLDQHHRAIADTKATVEIFLGMLNEYKVRKLVVVGQFNEVVERIREHEIGYSYHMTVLVKNEIGLKNLFKLVSYSHIDYFVKEARLPLEVVQAHREGLLFGSACMRNDVFTAFLTQSTEQVQTLMEKYDFIEVQPPHIYEPLIYNGTFKDVEQLEQALEAFIKLAIASGKIVVATGDVHQLEERDTVIRQMYVDTQVGVHPLARKEIKKIPAAYLMTTEEMTYAFKFLKNERLIEEIVVENTHHIADMINPIKVIKDELFTPSMDNVDNNVREMVIKRAKEIYGENLPELIEERVTKELNSIIGHGFAVIYYICHKIVKKSLDDGYIVGSRGSVGSSIVATMMEITEVNPLPPHYVCPHCQYSQFFGSEVRSGFDLPDKKCPHCETNMNKDGHDIPFETFLGFEGDKVPDIDLNFSGEYQPIAHDYTKVLFGEENVYRAGTISTIAEKTAYGYVRGYANDHPEMDLSLLEIDRLTGEVAGVKKTTGRHAGGVIVVPKEMEIYDITPIQYPADGKTGKEWKTTHFDFHAIHDNLLKLDLLGHDDPTIIRMLQDLSGIEPTKIPVDDPLVYSLFSSVEALNLQKPIFSNTGSLGLPEFGTEFVRQMLEQTNPSTFAELVQISGLSHGTDVWLNNAQLLVRNGTCELKDVIGCRDDIMVYLIYKGLPPSDAFTIMELVRKGKFTTGNESFIELMRSYEVPEWYIDSCTKIKYMFPKAHATAYVMMAVRIAWFKVHLPLYFYASLFSVRGGGKTYEIDIIMGGYEVVKARIEEIVKMESPTNKEIDTKGILDIVLEMLARGLSFEVVDLYRSHEIHFLVDNEKQTLLFPFQAVDGLGENVAKMVVVEAAKGIFLSKEDLQKRTGVSKTVLAKLEVLRVLEGLADQNQMSLF